MPAALITGASSGLGTEFARLCAADGADVVLVARRQDRLDPLARRLSTDHGVKAHVVPADLAAPGAVDRIIAVLEERGVEVELLVNNAGFGSNGPFADSDPRRELDMVAVNVSAVVELTRALLPRMLTRGSGRILNVGSTAGFQPGPYMATYYATKAFLNSFSEALWFELKGTGVTVTVSCPGPVATEFAGVAGNDGSRLFTTSRPADPARIAREAYDAMRAGKSMIVHGLSYRLMMQSLRIAPRAMPRALAASLNRPVQWRRSPSCSPLSRS